MTQERPDQVDELDATEAELEDLPASVPDGEVVPLEADGPPPAPG